MNDTLDAFLARERARKFSWADTNCGLWVADWIKLISDTDPAAHLRGRAADPDGWREVLKAEGGFMPMVGWLMDKHGFERTLSPGRGDVAIVSVPGIADRMPCTGVACVICLSPGPRPMCAARSLDGLHFESYPLITAWRVTFDSCKTTPS